MPVVTNLPEYMNVPELKGVFVEGCIERGDGSSFRAKAHAHTGCTCNVCKNPEPFEGIKGSMEHLTTMQRTKGWICIRSAKRLEQKSLLIHELAHIITGQGHTDKWREKVKELGGKINYWETKNYHKLKKAGYGRVTRNDVGPRMTKFLLARAKSL